MLQGDGLQGEVSIIRGIKMAYGVKRSRGVRERYVGERANYRCIGRAVLAQVGGAVSARQRVPGVPIDCQIGNNTAFDRTLMATDS